MTERERGAVRTRGIGAWFARQIDETSPDEAPQDALRDALRDARAAADREIAHARAQANDYRAMLEQVVSSMGARVREVQLPLHILLDTPFGALNENQEELLGAARQSAEAADTELRALRRLLDEPSHRHPDADAITVTALLAPALAVAASAAEGALVRLLVDVPADLPPVRVSVRAVQESLATVLLELVDALPGGADIALSARAEGDAVALRLTPPPDLGAPSFRLRLAIQMLRRYADRAADHPSGCLFRFPITDLLERVD